MNEIEIEHQCYCADSGMFCPFMDRYGYCYATNCEHVWDFIEQMRIDEQARMSNEKCEAMLAFLNEKEVKQNEMGRNRESVSGTTAIH